MEGAIETIPCNRDSWSNINHFGEMKFRSNKVLFNQG